MNSKAPKTAKFDRIVGMAQQLHKMVSPKPSAGGMHDSAKKNYETPALSRMAKMASALGKKMGIPDAHEHAGGHAEGGEHRPSKEQSMHFAKQLLQLPRPGQSGGNILKETMQYGKKVQALSQSLRTPPAAQSGSEHGAKTGSDTSAKKSATSEAHPFQTLGKAAAVQRMQTIMQTMHAPAHPVHKVMDVLSDFSQGKIDKDGLREHISAIGAKLPPKGGVHGGNTGTDSFGKQPEIKPKGWEKQVQGFVAIGASNNAALIIAAHQAMSSKIAAKLKSAQKTAAKEK